jgi:hypothetical protein
LLLLLLAACPAAHSDYPGKSCMNDNDCYEGEICQISGNSGTCVNADGGSP